MRKTLILLSTLVIFIAVNAGASGLPENSKVTLSDGDSLIYPGGDTSLEPLILHRGAGSITVSPYQPESSKPNNDGLTLDVPANDDCANAIAIGEVEDLPVVTMEATVDGGNFSNFPNIWYLYTPTITGRIKASLKDDDEGYNNTGRIAIYDGSTCPENVNIPDPVELQGGEFIQAATPITGSLPLAISGYFDEDNTRDHTCSCMFEHIYPGPDVVYSYTATADDSLTFILTEIGDISNQIGLVILDEDGNELACQLWLKYEDESGTIGPAIFNFPVVDGETYYLLVTCFVEEFCSSSNYILTIYPSDSMIDISYKGLLSYTDIIFDAVAGNQYLIEVSYVDPTTTSTLSVGLAPDPPENDSCVNATDGGILEPGETIQFTGDNSSATYTNPAMGLWATPEVWIKFTLDETQTVKLDYCGTTAIGGILTATIVITRDCAYGDQDEWYMAEPEDFIDSLRVSPSECPNTSVLLYWENLPPGTYYYPMLLHHQYQGEYVINVTGMGTQDCDDDALFGQEPSNYFTTNWMFYISDFESAYGIADKFNDVNDRIYKITWWGAYIDLDGEYACDPLDSQPFQIALYDFDETSPYIPGNTIGVYDLTITPEATGFVSNDYFDNEIPQYRYVAMLPETLDVDDGWLMIRGNDDTSNDCGFFWQNSLDGYSGVVYDAVEESWTQLGVGFSFCLGDAMVGIDDDVNPNLPLSFELLQNYPNPFNATTSIQFSLKNTDDVSLTIYDINGRLIKSLHNGTLTAGLHNVVWDGTNESGQVVSSGIYFCRLNTSEKVLSNKMILLK